MGDLESTFHDENVSLEALQSSTTQTPERVVRSSTTKPSEGAVVPLSAPHVNMIFSTLDDAKKYYIEYGRQEGFSTRVRTTAKRKCHDGEVSSCAIVCAREGEHTKYEAKEARDPECPIKTRNSSTTKCGCKAIMRLTRRNDGSWGVTVYNDEHSHKLVSPGKRMRMKVNRVFPNAAKALVERFDEENLPIGKVALVLGGDSLGFNERDCHNHLNSIKRKYKTPKDGDADYDSEHTVRVVDKGLPLQKHAARTYTRALYDKFSKQLEKAQYDYKIHSECPGEECTTYIIRSRKAGDTVEWEVTFSLAIGEGWCECKLFQFMGIPCGHILKVFLRHDLDEIPTFFLLRRWLQGANQYRSKDESDIVNGAKGSNMQRLFSGFQLATEVVREAAEDQEDFTLLVDTLTALSETFATRQRSRKSQVPSVASSSYDKEEPNLLLNPKKSNANVTHHEERQDSDCEDENENVVLDEGRQNMVNEDDEDTGVDMSQSVLLNLQVSQTKGRPRGNKTSTYVRQKSGLEKALEARKRKCNFCGIKGAGHDARNCELNPNRKVKRPNKAVSSGEPER